MSKQLDKKAQKRKAKKALIAKNSPKKTNNGEVVAMPPATITSEIVAGAVDILGFEPEFHRLTLEPVRGLQPQDCHRNVINHIRKHGGKSVYCWKVYETAGLFINYEFHSLWEDPSGKLRDITPGAFAGDTEIVYFIDPVRKFEPFGEKFGGHTRLLVHNEITTYHKYVTDRDTLRDGYSLVVDNDYKALSGKPGQPIVIYLG